MTTTPPSHNTGTHDELLVALCRLAAGDSLRSVTHFTPRETTVLYRNETLSADGGDGQEDGSIEEELLTTERLGFSSVEGYNERSGMTLANATLGDYKYTLRAFENGFVCRFVVGNNGLLLTTVDVDVDRFGDLAAAIQRFFEAAPA